MRARYSFRDSTPVEITYVQEGSDGFPTQDLPLELIVDRQSSELTLETVVETVGYGGIYVKVTPNVRLLAIRTTAKFDPTRYAVDAGFDGMMVLFEHRAGVAGFQRGVGYGDVERMIQVNLKPAKVMVDVLKAA